MSLVELELKLEFQLILSTRVRSLKWIQEYRLQDRYNITKNQNPHIGELNPEHFETGLWPLTKSLLIDKIDSFIDYIPSDQCDNVTHFIQYEKLKKDRESLSEEIRDAVKFITSINSDQEKPQIRFREECLLDEGSIEGKFHRPKNKKYNNTIDVKDLFSDQEKQAINLKLDKLSNFLSTTESNFKVPENYFFRESR